MHLIMCNISFNSGANFIFYSQIHKQIKDVRPHTPLFCCLNVKTKLDTNKACLWGLK